MGQKLRDERDRVWGTFFCPPTRGRGPQPHSQVVVTMVKNRLAQQDAQTKGWLLDGRAGSLSSL